MTNWLNKTKYIFCFPPCELSDYTMNSYKYLLLLLMSVFNLWVMHLYFVLNGYMEDVLFVYSYVVNFFANILDVSLILFVFLCLTRGRLRTSAYIAYLLTLLWSFCNVFYGRFFSRYLTLSAIGQYEGLADDVVIKSMLSGFQWSDLYYLISLFAFLYIVLCIEINEVRLSWGKILSVLSVPVISLLTVFMVYSSYHLINPKARGNNALYKFKLMKLVSNPTKARNLYPNDAMFNAGVVRTLLSELDDILFPFVLTKEQRQRIIKEYQNYDKRSSMHEVNPQIKNVILVLLESFLSATSDLVVDGKRITPFLDSLKLADETYYNGFVHSNITCGESGDGQFIYMTGLLPLRSKYVVGEAKDKNIPFALPKLLRKHLGANYSEIIIPSSLNVWQQENMNHVYGLNFCYSKFQVIGNHVESLTDETVFKLASETDKINHQPFFSMVLSISTHQPYNRIVDPDFALNDNSFPQGYLLYLNACHNVDTQLKKYIEHLKNEGIYDNSLIIITSDHHAHMDAVGMAGKISPDLPLYIIHGNIDKTKAYFGPCNQLDVYTTILDVLGIASEWRGLGHTLLNANYHNSVSSSTYDISEQIIMNDFFNKDKSK